MWLAIDLKGALDYIQSPRLIRNDTIVPAEFSECADSPYRRGYDWLYQYERKIAAYLEPWLKPHRYDLIGEKGLLCEALSNAFSHGHGKDPQKAISVRVYLGARGLLIRVSDTGKGFNINDVIQGYLRKKVYYHTAGNGIQRMAISKKFGIFYNRAGTAFHLLYVFNHRFDGLTILEAESAHCCHRQLEGHRQKLSCYFLVR